MKKSYFLGVIVLGAIAWSAQGDIIPTFTSPAVAEASNFRWNYQVDVTLDQRVEEGDFFTIYDFGGFVPGTNAQPAGWTFSSALVGQTPGVVLPADDAGFFNLTWTYTGTAGTLPGPDDLGDFSAVSAFDLVRAANFAAQATRADGDFAGTKISNIGTVAVPVPEMSALLPIIGVCGVGLLGVGRSLLRRRQAA